MAGPAFSALGAGPARAQSATLLTLVLDLEAPPTVSARRAIAAFTEKRLPIGLLAAPPGPEAADSDWPSFDDAGGLIELVAEVPPLAGAPRYAQMRAADGLRQGLRTLAGEAVPARSLLLRDGLEGIDLPAFRVSQFRVLMAPGGGAAVSDRPVGRGQLLMEGGLTLDPGADLVAQLDPVLEAGGSALAILPLAGEDDGWLDRVEALANRLDVAARDARVVMLRPMDHLLQSGAPLERNLAVLIDGREAPGAARAFRDRLAAARIPATLCLTPREAGPEDCLALDAAALLAAPRDADLLHARCLLLDADATLPDDFAAPLVVHPPQGVGRGWTGLAPDGRLHARAEAWPAAVETGGILDDGLLFLTAADLGTERQRDVIEEALRDARADSRLWPLDDWAAHLMAPDVLHDRYLAARPRGPADGPRGTGKPDGALIRDARTAWGYIADNTLPGTGHAVPTLAIRGERLPNMDATLWDCGSQVFGTLAAAHMGLIPAEDCAARIGRVVDHIPTITIDGARLPPAIFDIETLRTRQGGFDICDLGRFLLSLDKAVAEGALLPAARDRLVGGWDIEVALGDGRLHSYRDRRWEDVTVSHCTDYILPAFHRLGFSVANIYHSPSSGLSEADRDMANLAVAASAGAIGAEPSLLSLVEGSESASAEVLSRVLYDAQSDHFEEGGGLRAPSETPLDRAPWFTYQGLALDLPGASGWVINPVDDAAAYQTPEFRREAEVVVAKAAYLWRAVRRSELTDALIRSVREGCREEEGFCVGIYARSGEPMSGYYDINTNGIILTAIGSMVGPA